MLKIILLKFLIAAVSGWLIPKLLCRATFPLSARPTFFSGLRRLCLQPLARQAACSHGILSFSLQRLLVDSLRIAANSLAVPAARPALTRRPTANLRNHAAPGLLVTVV